MSEDLERDLVLVGGGHAHVEVVRRLAAMPEAGLRVTLVSRTPLAPYSGMLPGMVARRYAEADAHIDLWALCQPAQIRFIVAEAVGLDLDRRQVRLAGRAPLAYDLLGLDIGSTPSFGDVPGAERHAIAVKPVDRFLLELDRMDRRLAERGRLAILVVGAGAGGSELALALRARYGDRATLALADAAGEPMPTHAPRARRLLRRALTEKQVALHLGRAVQEVGPDAAILQGGERIAYDVLIWTTQARPAAWLADSGLPVDERGFLRVETSLAVPGHPAIFGTGDMIAFAGRDLPKAGVFAVREGPVLAENLRRVHRGMPLRPFRPQARALALLSVDDGNAIASKGRLALRGGWLMWLKDRIDRRWIAMYQQSAGMGAAGLRGGAMQRMAEGAAMRCAGCAAKVGPGILSDALAALAPRGRGDLLLGLADRDDAAAFAWPAEQAVVASVDYFPAFVDDPWLFGRIAAVHAMGDLHATGAAPRVALATAVLPYLHPRLQARDMEALLRGLAEAVEAEGAVLAGGHSAEGPQCACGLTVIGAAPPGALFRKAGLRAGDALILTKPLGTGLVFAAAMRNAARGPEIEEALGSMQVSLRGMAAIARGHGAVAATDVTGFGLAGHLLEMLRASGTDAEIGLAALPALAGALRALADGIESTAAPGNRAHAAPHVEAGDAADQPRAGLLYDPQTAGGLLFGVAPAAVAPCVAALGPGAAAIGRVTQRAGAEARIVLRA